MYIPDLSHWHTVKDWDAIKRDCPFVIYKGTQGTNYIDPTVYQFIHQAETNKVPYFLYAYLNKGGETEQAKFLVQKMRDFVGPCFMGYVLDCEERNNAIDIITALSWLSRQSNKIMFYAGYKDYANYKNVILSMPNNCVYWEARYGRNKGLYMVEFPPHQQAALHQYTSRATYAGVNGHCDMNKLTGKVPLKWFTDASLFGNGTITEAPKQPVSASEYKVGNIYTLQVELRVRKGPGGEHGLVGYKNLTPNAKAHDSDRDGALDKGTKVTCKEVKQIGNSIWMRIPSGWVCAFNGVKKYVK